MWLVPFVTESSEREPLKYFALTPGARLYSGASITQLPEYPLTITGGGERVEALSLSLACFASVVRQGIDRADELVDKETADIFTEISRSSEVIGGGRAQGIRRRMSRGWRRW